MLYSNFRNIGVNLFLIGGVILPKYGLLDFCILFGLLIFFLDITYLKYRINFKESRILIPLLILLLFTILTMIIYDNSFGFVRVTRVLLLIFISAYISRYITWNHYLKFMYIAIVLHLSLLYAEYFNLGGGREMIININGLFYENRDVLYRAKGLFPGYSSTGIFCGISSVFIFYYILEKMHKSSVVITSINFLIFLIALFSTVFTSRGGMLIAFLGILLVIFFKLRKLPSIKLLVASTFILSVVFIAFISINPKANDNFDITLIRAFEMYDNYLVNESISTASTTSLKETITIPSQFPEFLIGNGRKPWSVEGSQGNSDSGYIQSLHMYGVLGTLLYYMPFFLIIFTSFIITLKRKSTISTLTFCLSILMMISEIKGHYLYSNIFFIFYGIPFFLMTKKLTSKKDELLFLEKVIKHNL